MAQARFISTEYLYKHTTIDANVDADYLTKFIDMAQDLQIQLVLGNALFVKIKNDIASTGTTTGYYLSLLTDYVQRATAEWTVYYALPHINYHITNKAVSTNNSDSSNASDVDTLKWLRQQVRDNAEFYSERVRDYLRNNSTQFPELYATTGENIRPTNNSYYSGMYLGKGLKNNYNMRVRKSDNDCDC